MGPRKKPPLFRRAEIPSAGPEGLKASAGRHCAVAGVGSMAVSRGALPANTVLGVVSGCPASRAFMSCTSARNRSYCPHLMGHCSSRIQVLWLNQQKVLLWGVCACMRDVVSGSASPPKTVFRPE